MSSSSSSWIELLPRVLMATSSILVDISLEETRDRILVQVALWWMAVLPSFVLVEESTTTTSTTTATDFWILLNGVFFVRLVMIRIFHYGGLLFLRRNRFVWVIVVVEDLCRVFPLATYMGFLYCYGDLVYYDYFHPEATNPQREDQANNHDRYDSWKKYYILIVCMTILWTIVMRQRRHQQQQKQRSQSQQQQHQQQQSFFDESQWIHWNQSQLVDWLSITAAATLPSASLENNHSFNNHHQSNNVHHHHDGYNNGFMIAISRLQNHNVTGSTLQYIQLQDLLYMRIPFGTSCHLLNHIQTRLLQPYPPPTSTHSHPSLRRQQQQQDNTEFSSSWETLLQPTTRMESQKEATTTTTTLEKTDPLMDEAASDIMKQRFHHFRLPIPASQDTNMNQLPSFKDNDDHDDPPPFQQRPHAQVLSNTSPQNSKQLTPPNDTVTNEDTATILQAMPPHIQEIAARNPQLVQQFLQQQRTKTLNPIMEEEDNKLEGDPSAILQVLPPHIREIASKNPQLLQQVMRSQKHTTTTDLSGSSSIGPPAVQQAIKGPTNHLEEGMLFHVQESSTNPPQFLKGLQQQQQQHITTTNSMAEKDDVSNNMVFGSTQTAQDIQQQQPNFYDNNNFATPEQMTDDFGDEQEMLLPPPPLATNTSSARKRSIQPGGLGFL